MQFAYPPRKNSNPQPYSPRSFRSQWLRSDRLRPLAILALGILALLFLLSKVFGGGGGHTKESIPAGTAPAVIVTVFDMDRNQELRDKIKTNREQYAKRHGVFS